MCCFFAVYNAESLFNESQQANTPHGLARMANPEAFNAWLELHNNTIRSLNRANNLHEGEMHQLVHASHNQNFIQTTIITESATLADSFITPENSEPIFLPADEEIVHHIQTFRATGAPQTLMLHTPNEHWIVLRITPTETIISDSLNTPRIDNQVIASVDNLFRHLHLPAPEERQRLLAQFRLPSAQEQQNAREVLEHNQQLTAQQHHLIITDTRECETLIKHFSDQASATQDHATQARMLQRTHALDLTRTHNNQRFDYASQIPPVNTSSPYATPFKQTNGTAIDQQLHIELIQTRNNLQELEHTFTQSHHVKTVAPLVYFYTSLAKQQQQASVAFDISDLCHNVTQALTNALRILHTATTAVGRGAFKGLATTLSPHHWQEMATGSLQLALHFCDAIGQQEARQNLVLTTAFSPDTEKVFQEAQRLFAPSQAQKDAVMLGIQQTSARLQKMSWPEILEHGTELGTTILLDTLACNALGGFARATSKTALEAASKALNNPLISAKQHAIEIAGFGKLMIEDGIQTAGNATEIIQHEHALFAASTKTDRSPFDEFKIGKQHPNFGLKKP